MNLDYYYGTEEMEQFTFFRMPKILMKNETFKKLSSDAKLLYTFMLDRMTLSIKKGWVDKENRVFIYYTIENIAGDLGCCKDKGMKVLAELDSKKGIGLIERKRQGQGKPDKIYVKNFTVVEPEEKEEKNIEKNIAKSQYKTPNVQTHKSDTLNAEELEYLHQLGINPQLLFDETTQVSENMDAEILSSNSFYTNSEIKKSDEQFTGLLEDEVSRLEKSDFKGRENQIQEVDKSECKELINQKTEFKELEIQTSRSQENQIQDFCKIDPNNTNINNTENNYTELNDINLSINQSRLSEDGMDRIDGYEQIIRENIEYDCLLHDSTYGTGKLVEELYGLICDTICSPRETIRIAGSKMSYELVKAQFLKLNRSHIEYVIDELKKNTRKIHNIKAYLLTALYNAPMTINSYFQQAVQHDMYNGDTCEIHSNSIDVTTEEDFSWMGGMQNAIGD